MKTKKGTIESFLKLLPKEKQEEPPSFHDLWDQAVKAIDILRERHPSEYWERATKSTHVPLLFPRLKKESNTLMKRLEKKGVIRTGRGRLYDPDHPMNKEVEMAYQRVFDYQMRLLMYESKHGKIDGRKHPRERQLLNLPRISPETYPEWKPWLVEAFMNKHDDSPEKSKELKKLVEERVNRNPSGKGKGIYRGTLSWRDRVEEIKKRSEATPFDYCRELVKTFKKAAVVFAKQMSWLRGTKRAN